MGGGAGSSPEFEELSNAHSKRILLLDMGRVLRMRLHMPRSCVAASVARKERHRSNLQTALRQLQYCSGSYIQLNKLHVSFTS